MTTRDKNPRFTVIIPTKDRAEYLFHSLRTCSNQDDDNLEIVVSDDGSVDDTRAVVEEAARKDPRIRYTSPGEPGAGVGMLDNFEHALDQVQSGYVLALGGDDGLMPHGIRGMRDVLEQTGKELLAWPTPAFFYAGTKMPTGQLVIHTKAGRPHTGTRIIKSADFLERQARELYYVTDIESPMFYVKGVTSIDLVNRVRSRTPGHRFYACATPDGYSGIVLAGEVVDYAFSGLPFSLHGVSPTSAGVGYLAKTEQARVQSEAFFKRASKWPMHRDLGTMPYSPLISLMTADYLLTAKDLPGWGGQFSGIDYKFLLDKALSELADGLFAEDRIGRELAILAGVAKHHGLEAYFRDAHRSVRRNLRAPLEGNAISPSRLYLDATEFGIHDIFDAAYVAHYLHEIVPKLGFGVMKDFISNSIRYRTLSHRKGARLPDESLWPDLG